MIKKVIVNGLAIYGSYKLVENFFGDDIEKAKQKVANKIADKAASAIKKRIVKIVKEEEDAKESRDSKIASKIDMLRKKGLTAKEISECLDLEFGVVCEYIYGQFK